MNKIFNFEHVPCDLCGSDYYIERYRKPDNWLFLNQFQFPVVECTNCGLVYVNPRPCSEDTNQYYQTGYHDGRNEKNSIERYAIQYTYVEQFKFKKVLDIGCARGDWLNYINSKFSGLDLYGIDAFCDSVNHASVKFHKGFLPEIDLRDNYFDLITAWAVFEHVHTPSSYFEIVSRILKTNGKFVFLVTNSESCYGKYAYSEDIPRHLYHFNKKTIEQYGRSYDLKVIDIFYDDRIWDGRGKGTFNYCLGKLFGVNWNKISLNSLNTMQKLVMTIGSIFDQIVFHYHWESRLKKSGVIVVIMEKSR